MVLALVVAEAETFDVVAVFVVAGFVATGFAGAGIGFTTDVESGSGSVRTVDTVFATGARATPALFDDADAGRRRRSPGWMRKGSAMPFACARSITLTPLREAMPYSESPACTTMPASLATGAPVDGHTFTVAGVHAHRHRHRDTTRMVERRTMTC